MHIDGVSSTLHQIRTIYGLDGLAMTLLLQINLSVIFLAISSIDARCPAGSSVKVYGHSGQIKARAGYHRSDECEWKLFPPNSKRNHKLTITISQITCGKNLIIEGEDFCQHKPRITRTYIPNSCKEDCRKNTCRKIKGYPLVITYGKYADDNGFYIKFSYAPCSTGPKFRPVSTKKVMSTSSMTTSMTTATTATPRYTNTTISSEPHIRQNSTSGAYVPFANVPLQQATTTIPLSSQYSPMSQLPIAAITTPIIIVLGIMFLAIIVLKCRKRKPHDKAPKRPEISTITMQSYISTPKTARPRVYETLTKKITTQMYTNEPTTHSQEPVDTQELPASSTHIYEQVHQDKQEAETPKVEHQYDEVASESDSFDECSSDEEKQKPKPT